MKQRLNALVLLLFSMLLSMPTFAKQAKFNNCSENILQNVKAHKHTSLNGSWQIIADPFDAGYYDYRLNIDKNGYFKNRQAEIVTNVGQKNTKNTSTNKPSTCTKK